MSDNANKMGTSMESITNAYQGFAKQNYTMLDNLKLGYGGTKTEMQRLLKDAQAISGVKYDISNLADVYSAIHVIQQQMGITNTTAREGAKTIEGSTKALSASWKNLLTGIADDNADFQGLIDAFIENLMIAGENMLPRITQAVKGVGKLIGGIAGAILENLPTIIQTVGELIKGIADGLSSSMTSILPIIQELINALFTYWTDTAPQFIQSGAEMINNLGQGLQENLPTFISKGLDVIQGLADFLTENVPILIESGMSFIRNMVQGLMNALPELIARVPDIITQFANVINDNAPTILMEGVGLIWDIINGLIQAIPDLIANIPQIIEAIVAVWQAFNWIQLGTNVVKFLGNGIRGMIGWAKSSIGTIKDGIVNFIKDLPSKLFDIGKNSISDLGGSIRSMLSYAQSSITTIGSGIVNTLKTWLSPSKIAEIGSNMIRGLWNGISNMTGWILDKIGGFANSVVSSIKGFFGIHSPSTVFRDQVGKNLALGLGEGFTDTMGSVTDEMISSIPTNFDTNINSTVGTSVSSDNNMMIYAFKEALKDVKVVMNDREMGTFVIDTVGKVVYSQ